MTVISGEKVELALISANNIRLHEECDDYRYRRLIERFKTEKVLYNPLIVGKSNHDFILLDGANRYEALRRTGCRTVLCQLVNYKSAGVILKSWHHFVHGINFNVLQRFMTLSGLRYASISFSEFRKRSPGKLNRIYVADSRSRALMIELNNELPGILKVMSRLTKFYESKYEYERIDSDIDPLKLRGFLPDRGLLFAYPRFKKHHIVRISRLAHKLPAGITRHMIPNRVLHIKYALSLLKNGAHLNQRNLGLQNLIQEKISQKKVRVYKEPIIIFDE